MGEQVVDLFGDGLTDARDGAQLPRGVDGVDVPVQFFNRAGRVLIGDDFEAVFAQNQHQIGDGGKEIGYLTVA